MAKRFFDSNIFDDPWFRKMKPNNKILWVYILCKCDHAGIWKADFELAEFLIGAKINLDEINNGKPRVVKFGNNKYFVPDFIDFQYGELNENVAAHRSVIQILNTHKLLDNNNLVRVSEELVKCNVPTKDKAKDKDKDIYIGEKKKKFGEYILLTESEYQKLFDLDGKEFVEACIERLDNYIGSTGKKYKSHYRTILNWVRSAELEKGDWKDG